MRYAQSSACSSGRSSASSPNRISQHRTVVQAIMVVVTTRPRRKPNTTSNAFGVERKDSLTLVTSWIASAAHQTGQRPPTGYTAVDLADTGTGTCSQRWVTGARGETASPKNCGSLTGSPSIAHARSTVLECSEGTSTGPAHGLWIRSLAQSASRFTTPFFPPLPGRPIARATRPIPLLVAPIAPGVVAVGTRGWPARLDPLGHVLRVPTRARARYSVTAPPRRLGSATFCIRLEARDTSHEACCDSSTRTAPESGGETSPDRHSPRSASIQLRWLPCPSSRPPENPIPTKQKSYFAQTTNAMSRSTRNPPTPSLLGIDSSCVPVSTPSGPTSSMRAER